MPKILEYTSYNGIRVPKIVGAGGGKGSGKITPNSLFSSDILYLVTALGEGPVYRINPNGPQDIQIQDSAIDDLLNMRGNGLENTDKFFTLSSSGTVTQDPLPKFGDNIVSPQVFASQVVLKKGNLTTIAQAQVDENTSPAAWDELRFSFIINELYYADDRGNVDPHTVAYRITIYDADTSTKIFSVDQTIKEKTDTPYKFSHRVKIPKNVAGATYDGGYRFVIQKISDDTDDSKIKDTISVVAWDEVEYTKQAYPRTAIMAYALKAVDEHTGGVPNFTSLVKGLIVKVPSNYNQPILADGQIDWRELEVPEYGQLEIDGQTQEIGYVNRGYRLQSSGTGTVVNTLRPNIYKGSWDGTFVYSWTQNPVWIIYDILTNKTYGLGIAEENIDKYKFYQVAMYCDACDPVTGKFMGVDAIADGTFRYKPRGLYEVENPTTAAQRYANNLYNQRGLPKGIKVKERRFITDVTISDQERTMDILNKITATFRSILTYSGGKVSLAVDMPDELPVMLFNESNMKQGSFQISGIKESETITGVDVSYIEPSNHFKRETVRLDLADANDGSEVLPVENILSLDLTGVTRRSQAIRLAQYQLAAARYQRRNITFITSTDALNLSPGDVITVSTQGTGVAYGFGGKVSVNSAIATASNTNVYLTHYTVPSISTDTFVNNTNPLALRVINLSSDRMELYILSNTVYSIGATSNVYLGADSITVSAISKFNTNTRKFEALTGGFTANLAPKSGDLWAIGEIEDTNNYYTNKSGKLFKVTGINRDSNEQEVTVNAVEYLSNIYVDSDSFINYEPVAYTDITSPFSTPPTPNFTFTASPKRALDGSITVDGKLNVYTDKLGYGQKYETEFYKSSPTKTILVSNLTQSSFTVKTTDVSGLVNGFYGSVLQGKNGFSTPIGTIKLLCTEVTRNQTQVQLKIPGLSTCVDDNFAVHVLQVNDGTIEGIKGKDYISLPVVEKQASSTLPNFVGYTSNIVRVSKQIDSYNINPASNYVYIDDTSLLSVLPSAPFYVYINQIQAKDYYSNSTFYVAGTETTHTVKGDLVADSLNTIVLPVKPKNAAFIRLYIDGKQKSSGYTVNLNSALSIDANVTYLADSADSHYRVEIDYYTVPSIEVGDLLEVSYGNTFSVINTTYSTASAKYDAARTSNNIFAVQLSSKPSFSLSGYNFINITENPVGVINNVNKAASTFTFDYDSTIYPGSFSLANSRIYTVHAGSEYEKLFLTEELVIPNLPIGTTSVKARTKNVLGRYSPYVEKYVIVEELPIQKVENLTLTETLYREQLAGTAIRVTCSFDHIENQEVTDYEISYKFEVNPGEGSFNTVKVSATGAAEDGKINFTVNNVDRGARGSNARFYVKVTPLNKSIRGITAETSIPILGKQLPPTNILDFTGGQQNEAISLLWNYNRDAAGDLVDPDLQDVLISKVKGSVEASIENFNKGIPVATVSANLNRVTVPIDVFGEHTYLAVTRDTSGNISTTAVATRITTVRPLKNAVIAAYNEDDPSQAFTNKTNKNSTEYYFPSRANATNGLSGPGKSAVDNANGSSSGFSVALNANDIIASGNATYITQVRDFGGIVTGVIYIDIDGEQNISSTYNNQLNRVYDAVSIPSGNSVILRATGIGSILGFSNNAVYNPKYDTSNRTWVTGANAPENVWAIWNFGRTTSDTANANSYALIAGLINADAVVLGESFYANGQPTGGNALSNVTTIASPFSLVDLKQYSDVTNDTYSGSAGTVTSQTYIRTSTTNPFYSNSNVNTLVFSSTSDGFTPFETGTRTFRYLQIKHVITNKDPNNYDFTLDRFRYTIEKEKTVFDTTVTYTSIPTTIDLSSAKFTSLPVFNFTVTSQTDQVGSPAVAVITSSSETNVTFRLVYAKGTGDYPGNGTATVSMTAIGV